MFDNQLHLFKKVEIRKQKKSTRRNKADILTTYKEVFAQINWMQLLGKIVKALKVPLIAAKYQLITRVKTFIYTRPFPWFKVSLVILFLYVFFQKDIQFQINMGVPASSLSEEEKNKETSQLSMNGFAQTANFFEKKATKKVFSINLPDQDVKAYIDRFTKVALVEMRKYGIPASIKMGQGLLASQAGKNNLAQQYNNHFGTICKNQDNCKNVKITNQNIGVKSYQSAWESWRAHSQLLSTAPYVHLRKHDKSYQKWAKGLESIGYGNHKNSSEQLIQTIEKYQLFKLDELSENL